MRSLKCTVTGGVLLVLVACSSSAQAPKQMAASDVVARVGTTPITLGEVDDRALQRPASDFGGARSWCRRSTWRDARRSRRSSARA